MVSWFNETVSLCTKKEGKGGGGGGGGGGERLD